MNNLTEIWLPIKGYEGSYSVSSFGRIKSLKKYRGSSENILSDRFGTRGYKEVFLFLCGKGESKKIHRLVAQAFIPNPENKPQVNHKNGIKQDNGVENLEWATAKENTRHAFRIGLKHRGQCPSNPVSQFNLNNVFLNRFNSQSEAQEKTGVAYQSIGQCCVGKLKTAGKFKWEFAL